MNEKEFTKFVEEHDIANYWNDFEDVDIEVDIPIPTKKNITMKIYPYLLREVKSIAGKKGIPYQSLIQQWIAEKISEEK